MSNQTILTKYEKVPAKRLVLAVLVILLLVAVLVAQTFADENPCDLTCEGETIFDDFEDGDASDDWHWADTGANGIIEAVTDPVSPGGGNYVGKVTFSSSCYGPGKRVEEPVTPDYISMYFRADGSGANWWGLGILIQSYAEGYITQISYSVGELRYRTGPYVFPTITPASSGVWYFMEFKNFDWVGKTFDIWVDGEEKVTGAPFLEASADNLYRIRGAACPSANGPIYLDDIKYGYYVPTVGPITAPVDLVQVNTTIDASANFFNPGATETHTATWEWGDESISQGTVTESGGSGSVEGSHTYTDPGVYTLRLTVTDDDGDSDESIFQYVVVYDPSAGFVTGGGWIDSPQNAYYPSDQPFFDGSYYDIFFSEEPLHFFDARDLVANMTSDTCTSAHLATITSQDEYDTVLELFDDFGGAVLGGYQDEGVAPSDVGWQWVTGEPFDFEATTDWWLPGEPNDCGPSTIDECLPGSEQVLEMYPEGWNDVPFYEPKNVFAVEYEGCDPGPTGKAAFGFVSEYKKGASAPTGNTEFNFKAGNLNFHSDEYQWLVINQGGTNAQYKGSGTINGDLAPNDEAYKFMIWAKDEDPVHGDTFRIKIWYEDNDIETIVYDNGFDQSIGGGNITIHTK